MSCAPAGGTLLPSSALIASFLGGQAISRDGVDPVLICALLAFTAVVLLSAYLLLPKDELVFALDGPSVYEALYGLESGEPERRLAYWLGTFRARNQPTLDRMTKAFKLATAALIAETGLLAAALAVS